jgi:2-keto-4-pentenoate hydratase/2-oxohepta-3-ene-1,7-dioic acid hydratase in catechol pathway
MHLPKEQYVKISRVQHTGSEPFLVISMDDDTWYRVGDLISEPHLSSAVDILAFDSANPGLLSESVSSRSDVLSPADLSLVEYVLPFQPLSYRDFMLYEKHCIDAARGFVGKYVPRLMPAINIYEKITGKPFPKLKPKKRWYSYPIYYLGNHLTFCTHGDVIRIPSYTRELDYELELGAVLCKPLKNASPEEAANAIGGFVVFNDFSARDVQLDEMTSGFGPTKSKNFANSISNVVVSANEILPVIDQLRASVWINGEKIAENNLAGMHYSLPEAIAYASWEEELHPGEFFGSGTVPGCTGIENGRFLSSGDSIRLEIKEVGVLENKVA